MYGFKAFKGAFLDKLKSTSSGLISLDSHVAKASKSSKVLLFVMIFLIPLASEISPTIVDEAWQLNISISEGFTPAYAKVYLKV